ncbi:MAG: hypothetical protein K6G10_01780 [Butyrivibrio sp.]|nr:hypothetical protein [Butyrivibrio sp.]
MYNLIEAVPSIIYVVVIILVIAKVRKNKGKKMGQAPSMPHVHPTPGTHVTFNKKSRDNSSGTMPHSHEREKYVSMADASHLPPGYILLNGEPVRVADLEGK